MHSQFKFENKKTAYFDNICFISRISVIIFIVIVTTCKHV
ncbi:hypothetical protein DYY67_1345 [Candidatus Nitrosotalea sp. TS]|nr:hypothetical protein [Candidatus Nitrosotalea sp. TS]